MHGSVHVERITAGTGWRSDPRALPPAPGKFSGRHWRSGGLLDSLTPVRHSQKAPGPPDSSWTGQTNS